VAWVRWARYSRRRPTADEVLLIIEIADSSLRYDRGEKAEMYASAGIADYWVVDIPNQAVHVYRNPEAGRFASCESVRGAARVSPLRIPTAVLVVESIFVASEPEADVGEHPTDDRAI
jgi:Uma2 family endonuclease